MKFSFSFALPILTFILGLGLMSTHGMASTDLDRKYALETVGFLRSWDNVDGLFSEYVSTAYREYLSHQSRFVLQDLSKADPIFSGSKMPYNQAIYDSKVLAQLSRSLRVENIVRTKIQKEGAQYRFTVDWLHAPEMDLVATEEYVLKESPTNDPSSPQSMGLQDLKGSMQRELGDLILKLPFMANVTGRDDNSVTVSVGAASGLKKGDTLVIGTIDEVKKHPLLKTIVDWRMSETGKLMIEQAEEGLAFCKITEEDSRRPIARYQKVMQIIPKAPDPLTTIEKQENHRQDEPPRTGWVSGGLGLGGFSRQIGSSASSGKQGSGMLFGGSAETQVWLTREFFAELGLGYNFASYSQIDLATGQATAAPSVSATISQFRIDAGYTYLLTEDFFGPRGWVKAGLQSASYSLPISSAELTSPVAVKALFVGIGGDLPIRGRYGVLLSLNFGLLPGASSDDTTLGTLGSASDVTFYVGGYYRYTHRINFRLGIQIQSDGASYTGGAAGSANLSQKTVTVVPALLYYF